LDRGHRAEERGRQGNGRAGLRRDVRGAAREHERLAIGAGDVLCRGDAGEHARILKAFEGERDDLDVIGRAGQRRAGPGRPRNPGRKPCRQGRAFGSRRPGGDHFRRERRQPMTLWSGAAKPPITVIIAGSEEFLAQRDRARSDGLQSRHYTMRRTPLRVGMEARWRAGSRHRSPGHRRFLGCRRKRPRFLPMGVRPAPSSHAVNRASTSERGPRSGTR